MTLANAATNAAQVLTGVPFALLHILTPCPACCVIAPAPALQVWVTEKPRTEPTFPGANLWFFCSGGLNFLGTSIDPCIKK